MVWFLINWSCGPRHYVHDLSSGIWDWLQVSQQLESDLFWAKFSTRYTSSLSCCFCFCSVKMLSSFSQRERERDFCSFLAQVQLKQVGNLNSSNMIMKSTGVCVSNQTLLHQNTRAAFVSMKRLYALQCGVDALLSRRVRKFIFSSNVNWK